ncbi:hypothetical protein EVAR_87942_1 [Eumeta japonica]|uniref:Uncharacterized protein n=1 Tax=Eumeta variegata TaxID=151549 RepID=A0A4C1VCK8_EUMVA|nr:hypothetical protein EVAR_87942_1 [Eumeta japonica]
MLVFIGAVVVTTFIGTIDTDYLNKLVCIPIRLHIVVNKSYPMLVFIGAVVVTTFIGTIDTDYLNKLVCIPIRLHIVVNKSYPMLVFIGAVVVTTFIGTIDTDYLNKLVCIPIRLHIVVNKSYPMLVFIGAVVVTTFIGTIDTDYLNKLNLQCDLKAYRDRIVRVRDDVEDAENPSHVEAQKTADEAQFRFNPRPKPLFGRSPSSSRMSHSSRRNPFSGIDNIMAKVARSRAEPFGGNAREGSSEYPRVSPP